ncbi:MAG: cold shock domain-containing protein [Perlabentimonas sp.]
MGRSQETFNKREKEKKRLKKKKDKLQKKEERKANTNEKTSSLDDMIAYVDEFGNLTSTPPDPDKKKKVKKEDIEVSVERQAPPDEADLIRKGKVTHFNESKGYGFIKDNENGDSIFFHVNGLLDDVMEGDRVTFETEKGLKGLNAVKVKLVD